MDMESEFLLPEPSQVMEDVIPTGRLPGSSAQVLLTSERLSAEHVQN